MTDTDAITPISLEKRRKTAEKLREEATDISQSESLPKHRNNGEEEEYLGKLGVPVANFTKGLPHDAKGEVKRSDYEKLRDALREGDEDDFAAIPRDPKATRKYTAPQTGLSFELEGPDAWARTIPPAPLVDSLKGDAEMVELYWMALTRDVPFIDYGSNPDVAAAAAELDTLRKQGLPKEDVFDQPRVKNLTPGTVFRGLTRGDITGPYVSQFLLHDIPFGSLTISAQQRTAKPGVDYMTTFDPWLEVQRGVNPPLSDDDTLEAAAQGKRLIRNLRDLARYVHVDQLHQAYFNAALLLLSAKNLQLDDGNPYVGNNKSAKNQDGFGVFGGPALLTLLTEVASRALKAVWFQKWFVHRRQRPEEWGGRIEAFRSGRVANYPVTQRLLGSVAHQRILKRQNTSLLPQAFPEGSPLHPAYGTGHGTVAGACVTILKAWLKGGDQKLKDLVKADGKTPLLPISVPSADGKSLVPYTGADLDDITVEGELNKLAGNIATARNGAGVHWRSDYTAALHLGQSIALDILQEQSICYNEENHFTVVDFDGNHLRIEDGELEVTSTAQDAA
ncbi:vanadium-dependent haloperoxidase [Archangium sp.]|uniref:vanadium-dependent haloperoxidase n=1 Tax=Archangium sp. TaxID=1872627 RepID=UPI00389B268B